jgi:hypothetical protein
MSPERTIQPGFGPSYDMQPAPFGIPITVVSSSHPKVSVWFQYATDSDQVRYPLGANTGFEVDGLYGDRHAVVVDRDTCRLYETWATHYTGLVWYAGSGATWDLRSNQSRPDGRTSADAAGLPILPGLLRYEEVAARSVDHAIRFTTNVIDRRYTWPARHESGSVDDRTYPPFGARFRLKASYDISKSLRPDTQAVLRAMKRYGLVLADNGPAWHFHGTADPRWPKGLIAELKQVPASAFEAVDVSSLMISYDSMRVRQ